MSTYTQAQAIADDGLAFGSKLWATILTAGLKSADEALQFGLAIDRLSDERPGADEANTLWHAYAMKAIPQERFTGPDRVIINRRADRAFEAYQNFLRADAAEQAADFAHDLRGEAA